MKLIYRLLILILVIFIAGSCNKKSKTNQEPLEFTREVPDFTKDRSNTTISAIQMTDITAEAGIHFKHETGAFGQKWMPETVGSGGGFFDYNNDGFPDIFLVNSKEWDGHSTSTIKTTSKLYKNLGNGAFQDVSEEAGINFSIYGMGASFADFDADGDIDIYLTAVGNNVLLRNDLGVFTNVTNQMNVSGNDPGSVDLSSWSTGAAWIDIDRDGWLDLFVANYVNWTPETDIYVTRDGKNKSYATPDVYEGESCRLYKNINGKHFEDITEKAGVLNYEGKSLGVAVADFNNDNWPDIVVSNDTQPNFLYINQGDGTFKDMAIVAGIGYDENGRARAGMGVDVADVENNGNLAIAIGNFSQEPLSLYTQISSGELFQDRAGALRLTRPSLLKLTFGLKFCDFDLDGFQDLITANGHIEPEINGIQNDITFEQTPQLFHYSEGNFVDISNKAGDVFNKPIVGRGISTGDFDKDGDLDVLITENGGSPKLIRNDSESNNNFISIQLKGQAPNLQGVGAKIILYYGGTKQQQMVSTGSSYLSQSDVTTVIFGIGKSQNVDSLKVIWPTSGTINTLYNLNVNEVNIVEE